MTLTKMDHKFGRALVINLFKRERPRICFQISMHHSHGIIEYIALFTQESSRHFTKEI